MTSAHRHEHTYVAFSRELASGIFHPKPGFCTRAVDILDAVEGGLDLMAYVAAVVLGERPVEVGGHEVEAGLEQLPDARVLPHRHEILVASLYYYF